MPDVGDDERKVMTKANRIIWTGLAKPNVRYLSYQKQNNKFIADTLTYVLSLNYQKLFLFLFWNTYT
jgi:hypothetical protein